MMMPERDPQLEARRLEDVLDNLCQDSLEAPLSHVDEPQIYDGQITAWFREARDIARALAQRVEDAEAAFGNENKMLGRVMREKRAAERENERLRVLLLRVSAYTTLGLREEIRQALR